MCGAELAVQIETGKKASKDRYTQGNTHAADVAYLDEGFSRFLIHRFGALYHELPNKCK